MPGGGPRCGRVGRGKNVGSRCPRHFGPLQHLSERSLEQLEQTARAVRGGDLEEQIPYRRDDAREKPDPRQRWGGGGKGWKKKASENPHTAMDGNLEALAGMAGNVLDARKVTLFWTTPQCTRQGRGRHLVQHAKAR